MENKSNSKSFFPDSAFLGGALLIVGVLLFAFYIGDVKAKTTLDATMQDLQNNLEERDKLFDDYFDKDFFGGHENPFKEMEKIRKQMMDHFANLHKGFNHNFDGWFSDRFGGGDVSDFSQREDDKYVYYEIKIPGMDGNKTNIKIENGMVNISGDIKEINESKNGRSEYISQYRRSLPVPDGVDAGKADISAESSKAIIKFPKKNGASHLKTNQFKNAGKLI